MFVSMNWIKDFVDLDGFDTEELIQRFTLSRIIRIPIIFMY